MDTNVLLERILRSYAENYDIERYEGVRFSDPREADGDSALNLSAFASMHLRESGYVLIRKAEMWNANSDEHVWFLTGENIHMDDSKAAVERIFQEGLSKVDPDDSHMCTRLVAFFICRSSDEETRNYVKSCKLRKDFMFSLKGWAEVHTVLVELDTETVTSNRPGKETADFAREVLSPKPKKTGPLSKLFPER